METWLLPYVDDFALWPVLVAVLGHVVVILVPLQLAMLRGPSLIAAALLALLLAGSGEVARMEVRARGRPGIITGVIVGTWAISVPCTYYANLWGVL